MSKIKPRSRLFPPWEMPSDPVKGVLWFLHWLLKVFVRFFWLPILGMVIYESIANSLIDGIGNGLIVGFITLLIGLALWGVLYVLLRVVNFWTGVSHIVSDVNQMRQSMYNGGFSYPYADTPDRVVEGSISEVEDEKERRQKKGEAF